jgi:hypothetical protein
MHWPIWRVTVEGSSERARVAINTIRARLTILGFNLAIITFQIINMRGLGGGSHLEGFSTVHLSAVTVLLIGVALSIAAMVAFIASSALDREGTCDHWTLLAGDLLMYLAVAQTVAGLFSPYLRALEAVSVATEAKQEALSAIWIGMTVAGSTAWGLVTYVGPIVSLVRSPLGRVPKLLHAAGYLGVLVCVSRLWWAAQRVEGRNLAMDGSLSAWLSVFVAPLSW